MGVITLLKKSRTLNHLPLDKKKHTEEKKCAKKEYTKVVMTVLRRLMGHFFFFVFIFQTVVFICFDSKNSLILKLCI